MTAATSGKPDLRCADGTVSVRFHHDRRLESTEPLPDPEHVEHEHPDVTGGWLRPAVFGAMDGLVSNFALITGVAVAAARTTPSRSCWPASPGSPPGRSRWRRGSTPRSPASPRPRGADRQGAPGDPRQRAGRGRRAGRDVRREGHRRERRARGGPRRSTATRRTRWTCTRARSFGVDPDDLPRRCSRRCRPSSPSRSAR